MVGIIFCVILTFLSQRILHSCGLNDFLHNKSHRNVAYNNLLFLQ